MKTSLFLYYLLTDSHNEHMLITLIGEPAVPRPHKCRTILGQPLVQAFKPAGMPRRVLETVELRLDEVEALRLADLEGLYHQQAAQQMGISRATFGRLLEQAHKKVADALLHGKMLLFAGGNVTCARRRLFQCYDCGQRVEAPFGQARPTQCPACTGESIRRMVPPTCQKPSTTRPGDQP